MKPISKQTEEFIKSHKITAHVDFDPSSKPHHEAQNVLLTTVAKYIAAKGCVTTQPMNGTTRKEVQVWCFTRSELRELIEKLQGL